MGALPRDLTKGIAPRSRNQSTVARPLQDAEQAYCGTRNCQQKPQMEARDKMKGSLREAVLKPGLAIAFCLLFGGGFVFFGFQTIRVVMTRAASGTVSGTLTRTHFWGLYSTTHALTQVTGAEIETARSQRTGRGRSGRGSNVVILCDSGKVRLLAGSSNVDYRMKQSIVERIDAYIRDQPAGTLQKRIQVHNVFGWIGLPFLIAGVAGLAGWPFAMVRHWRGRPANQP